MFYAVIHFKWPTKMLAKSYEHNRDYENDYMYVVKKYVHNTLLSKWPNLIDNNEVCSFFKHLDTDLSINEVSTWILYPSHSQVTPFLQQFLPLPNHSNWLHLWTAPRIDHSIALGTWDSRWTGKNGVIIYHCLDAAPLFDEA